MKIQDILSKPAEAAGREGPSNKIVLSSRVRLARNLAASPFPGWAKKSVRVETFTHIRDNVMEVEPMRDGFHTGMEDLSTLDKQILVERHFISREHAAKSAGSGMVLSGGGGKLLGLKERLIEGTSLPTFVDSEDPLSAVVRGNARILEEFERYRKVLY